MTNPATEDGNLPAALAKFRAAVCDLIDQTPKLHNGKLVKADSLYWQLQCAVSGDRPAAGSGTSKSRPPIWTEAHDKKQEIDTGVSEWCSGTSTPQKLRWLANANYRPQDAALLDKRADTITTWCADIQDLFDPPHVKHLSAPCPACQATHTYRRNDTGENVRVPALQIIAERGCTCVVCHATWAPDNYLWLCRVLGFDLPAGVLE